MHRRISEDLNDQITLKLSNLPNFYTVRSISVLLKQGAKLNVDKSIYYVEAVLDENGASNGVFLIRFLQPSDARDVRFKLNNLVLYGKLINVQVENKNDATPEFEKRFEQFLISEQARIKQRLIQIQEQKLHSQERLSPQSAAAYDPAIEAELDAILKTIEASLIQPPSTSVIKDNVVMEKMEKDDYDDEDDSLDCIVVYDSTKAEPFEISSDSSSIVDCEELCKENTNAEEIQPNIANERDVRPEDYQGLTEDNANVSQFVETNKPNLTVTVSNDLHLTSELVEDVISVTSSEDHNNDIMDVSQDYLDESFYADDLSSENEGTCKDKEDANKDKERSKIEIIWEQNQITEELQEILDDQDKTENDSFTNNNENTVTNTISSTDSTDVTKTMSTDINKIVASNNVLIAAKRKLDSNTDVGKSTASKTSKSEVGPSDSSQDDSGVSRRSTPPAAAEDEAEVEIEMSPRSVENLKAPMLRENRRNKYYGLNPEFLDYLGLKLPLSYRISVIRTGLYESVNETKLREVFSMAGKIRRIQIMDNNTAEILYDHPVEAVQAISMFNKRILCGKEMRIAMEYSDRSLPPGLTSIGRGLTMSGAPLLHVGAIAEQIELNEILCEMGRVKKTVTKKSPFSHFYKNKAINSENCTDCIKAPEKTNESAGVFRFTVPGTGEQDERPSDSETSKNALKELNQILKDRGLIPKNSECKKVKDILSFLKSKTIDQSKVPIQVNNMANTTVSTSNSIQCSSDVGSKTLSPNPEEGQNTKQQNINEKKPQTRQNVVPSKNIPQTRNLAQPPIPPLVKNQKKMPRTLLGASPFIPIPRIPLQSQPNFRPIRPTMQNTPPFQHNVNRYTSMNGNMRPQHGRGEHSGAIGLVFQNLPPRISEQILSQKMFEIGDLDFCKFIGFGTAIVRFKNPQDSHRCQQNFHNSTVDGRVIAVFYE